MELIDKTALVAEIERIREHVKRLRYAVDANCIVTVRNACECLESSIDLLVNSINTLEMKEVNEEPVSNDIEAEFVLYLKHKFNIPQEGNKLKTNEWRPSPYDLLDIAKHFAQWQKEQMVKEVDLEKEVHNAADQYDINNNGNIYWEDILGFAKHFFELGLKAKGE